MSDTAQVLGETDNKNCGHIYKFNSSFHPDKLPSYIQQVIDADI